MSHHHAEATISDDLIDGIIAHTTRDCSYSVKGKLFGMPSDFGWKLGIHLYRNNMATKKECRDAGKRMARNAITATTGIPNCKARVMQDPEHPDCALFILSGY